MLEWVGRRGGIGCPYSGRLQPNFITHNFIYALQVDDLTKESSDELGCRGVCDGGFGRQEGSMSFRVESNNLILLPQG